MPPETKPGYMTVFAATDKEDNVHTLVGIQASSVIKKPLEWIWPNRIPKGKITLFAGPPDCGKTLAACDVTARVTTGRDWPDGSKNQLGPRRVLFASTEDDPQDTLVPRLEAAGTDLSKVIILDHVTVAQAMRDAFKKVVARKKGEKRALLLTTHVKLIKATLRKNPDIALIVLDPLTAYLGADANKDKDVRPVMEALSDACKGTEASIVGLIHHNKRSDVGSALEKILGASSVAGVARAAWGFGRDPEDKDEYFMALVKGNVLKKRTGMKYRIEETEVTMSDGSKSGIPRTTWDGEIEEDANDMLAKQREQRDNRDTKIVIAKALITARLSQGAQKASEMYEAGKAEGISDRTMKNAVRELGVTVYKQSGAKGPWMWALNSSEKFLTDTEVM